VAFETSCSLSMFRVDAFVAILLFEAEDLAFNLCKIKCIERYAFENILRMSSMARTARIIRDRVMLADIRVVAYEMCLPQVPRNASG
jgi:hypothetical protein